MQRLFVIGSAVAIVLVGLVAACGRDPVSRNPLAPAAPSVGSLQISGPSSIAPGQSTQFIAETRLSDGTVKSSTSAQGVRWRSSNTAVLQVSTSGVVTAGQARGEANVIAEVLPNGVIRGTREVVVVPDGTYRVVGSVREVEAPTQPVIGARVEVSGTSLFTMTDFNGQYRLYGVPPAADIRVTANGYQSSVQSVQLTAHATQNFFLPLSGERISLNGPFTLTFDAQGSCFGSPALSADLQRRSYQAVVTTTGSLVDVLLTEPRFWVSGGLGNRFTGRTTAATVTFTLASFYTYYYIYYPNLAERLPNNTYLTIEGQATAVRDNNGGLTASMVGGHFNYDSRFPAFNTGRIGTCSSTGIRFSLTPR
jgi:carboxypeptidase family protein